MRLRTRFRLAALSESLPVILRAGGMLLILFGICSVGLTIHFTSQQLVTILGSKPPFVTRFILWFPAPTYFRTAGIIAAALGLVMILMSMVWARAISAVVERSGRRDRNNGRGKAASTPG
jgi:hypothetical protein